ncbi:glycosyltransferase family 39 protein [Candidatus Woesearchaeota archaeon]|nr:glycosyltransferase family 39 protein [Candidatus Woesearchaeota archaeon]
MRKDLLFLSIIFGLFVTFRIIHILTYFHFILWDEAVYLSIAKYFFSGGQYGLFETIRPLGLPLLLSLGLHLPFDLVLFSDIIIILFSLGTLFVVYLLGKDLFSPGVGVLSALLLSFHPIFFSNSLRILTGIPSVFFSLLAVYFFIRHSYTLCGVFSFFAFFFRYPHGLLVLVFGFSLLSFFLKDKDWKYFISSSIRLFLPFFILLTSFAVLFSLFFDNFFLSFFSAASHQNNPFYTVVGFWRNLFYYPGVIFSGSLVMLFSALGIISSSLRYRLTPIYFYLFFYLSYFTLVVNKQPRFAILFLPFFALFASFGVFSAYSFLSSRRVKTVFLIFSIFFLLSSTLSFYSSFVSYSSFPKSAPPIVSEYYSYFPDYLPSPILTSDPVPGAYRNVLFIPYYSSLDTAFQTVNSSTPFVAGAYFSRAPFPCSSPYCNGQLEEIFSLLSLKFDLAFAGSYEEEKYIFIRP